MMTKIIIEVKGMSCMVCAGKVESTVKGLPGVEDAAVNFPAKTITINYNPKETDLTTIAKRVKEIGFELVLDVTKTTLNVNGMSCVVCAGKVETAVKNMTGVVDAAVNFPSKTITVQYIAKEVSLDDIAKKVKDTGFELVLDENKVTLQVNGMSCMVCAGKVESTVQAMPGVQSASVNFPAKTITISYNTKKIKLSTIAKKVKEMGFELVIDKEENQEANEYKKARLRLIITWALASQVMVISMTSMKSDLLAQWAACLITLFILAGPGAAFFSKAWKMLKIKSANMDTLVALSTATAWIFSVVLLIFPDFAQEHGLGDHKYFDSAAMIAAFVLTGRLIEERAKNSTTTAIKKLMQLQPESAVVVDDEGMEQTYPIDEIKPGMKVKIMPGARIPVDAKIVSGESFVDESMLTGESQQIEKAKGDSVFSGTINTTGALIVNVEKNHDETTLAHMVEMVREAQGSKAPVQRIADIISKYFTFGVLTISILTFIIWFIIGGPEYASKALICAVSVLVIACPCALGLATPTAITVGIGRAAENHILIKDATALEKVCNIKAVVLDKTGTLTEGHPIVTSMKRSPETTDDDLAIFMAMEKRSEHPLAEEIVNQLHRQDITPAKVDIVNAIVGKGVETTVNGVTYWAGNKSLAQIHECTQVSNLVQQDMTMVYFGKGNQLLTILSLADTVKDSSPIAVEQMRQLGLRVYMLTGDNKAVAERVANEANISDFKASMSPDDKDKFIIDLQKQGKMVAMIGDGINDSQALARADVSIAMGSGTDIAMETAMMTFTTSDLIQLPKAMKLSKTTMRIVKQNLFWAFIYNIIGIPVAAGALFPVLGITINPMWASAAMAVSSLTVVLNSLRLKIIKIK